MIKNKILYSILIAFIVNFVNPFVLKTMKSESSKTDSSLFDSNKFLLQLRTSVVDHKLFKDILYAIKTENPESYITIIIDLLKTKNNEGYLIFTILHEASFGYIEIFKTVFEFFKENTPYSYIKIIFDLLMERDVQDNTPLHIVVFFGQFKIFKLILTFFKNHAEHYIEIIAYLLMAEDKNKNKPLDQTNDLKFHSFARNIFKNYEKTEKEWDDPRIFKFINEFLSK